LAVSLDDGQLQVVDTLAHNTDKDWSQDVSDGVRRISLTLPAVSAGQHTLHIWSVDPALVVEKLVLTLEPEKISYLGPPESYRAAE
jgi:glycosyl hydrolase family 115